MKELTHLDASGKLKMVDVSDKKPTKRQAVAEGYLVAGEEVMGIVRADGVPKGNIYEVARVAGIMAAKRTSDLIPLCHPLPIHQVSIEFTPGSDRIHVKASVTTVAVTGVEMEALTAVNVAILTLYDMLKALSKTMEITGIRLLEKSGGKSGRFVFTEQQ
ncbi:MAG TPA: cyclic pyranopterin monophosphate synthase MoaC [Bacteroidetes bacterium]|nr:cyclic pyranopterin monophosphate synthase accessory protein 2 [bacterium BMS3Bbin04]HDO65107.1 cyclic pyranopterin monophosphate synthase MoaC [Bacteroidota bacterium]HEX04232.1 cyclic pyranopterin monophosphate synthase MoaC [Bacteroidota bacterium]